MPESGRLVLRQIDLGDVARYHGLGTEAQAGEEHFHLLDGGVLSLIENHEALVQGTPAHERQRRHLDDVALDQARHPVEAQHLIESVVHRPQIRINFLRHVAGQKAEALASLDGRAHQHDPAHAFFLQSRHGARHGEIGFAGPGRPDAKTQVVGCGWTPCKLR